MLKTIAKIASLIDALNENLGKAISWVTLFLILTQFGIVLIHYVFHKGSIFMQESLLYMHSFIFLAGAGYTLLHSGHVRVDVAYSHLNEKGKAVINLIGTVIFLFPVCGYITVLAWPYVMQAWEHLEGSQEASGIQAVYILKSFILLFTFTMIMQGISLILNSLLTLNGQGKKQSDEVVEI